MSRLGVFSVGYSIAVMVIAGSIPEVSRQVRGADYTWQVPAGDWSVASNWGGTVPGSADTARIQIAGVASVTQPGATCKYLYVGSNSGGTVEVSSGDLTVTDYEVIEREVVTQSGGMHRVLGSQNPDFPWAFGLVISDSGVYSLSGDGYFSAVKESVGFLGVGTFNQTGGTNAVGYLYLSDYDRGDGTYNLSGSGYLSASRLEVGAYGSGTFNQSGGTNTGSSFHLSGTSGKYLLSGSGCLSYDSLQVSSGTLFQTAGLNVASEVSLETGGLYRFNGGTLQVNAGFDGGGTLDCAGSGTLVASGTSLVDLSGGNVLNTSAMTLVVAPNSIAVVPSTIVFGNVSNSGIIHTPGTTLTIQADQRFGGLGAINDPVVCQGSLVAPAKSGYRLDLANGLIVSGTGNVNLNGGTVTANDTTSSISGGSLSAKLRVGWQGVGTFVQSGGTLAGTIIVGNSGTGTFVQSAGVYVGSSMSVGSIAGTGAYTLSGTGQLNASSGGVNVGWGGTGLFTQLSGTVTLNDLILGHHESNNRGNGRYNLSGGMLTAHTEEIGETADGTFTNSGGTNNVVSFVLASGTGSTGIYNLDGGMLLVTYMIAGGGSGAFNFSGGTLRGRVNLSTSVPMTLKAGGSGPTFDTNGRTTTLSGQLSGPGSLTKVGGGALLLTAANTFSGRTLVTSGTLALRNPAALQQSTLDTSGAGNMSFGSLTAATLGGLTGAGALNLANSNSIPVVLSAGNNGADTTFSGSLLGSGSLTKVGTGTLTLTGVTGHAGHTTVKSGVLVAGAASVLSASSDMVVSGGTLDVSAYPNTVASLSATDSGSIRLGLGRVLTALGAAALNGTLNVSGTGTLGNYPLLTYTSKTGIFANVIGLDPNYGLFDNPNGTELDALHKAQVGAFSVDAANATVIAGGQTDLIVKVANVAPALSDGLDFTASVSGTGFGATATASVAAADSGSFTIAGGFNSSSLAEGTYSGTITLTGSNSNMGGPALGSGASVPVNVTVLGHASPALTINGNNPRYIVGAPGITVGLTLSNGSASQGGAAALDVNSLSGGIQGTTGGKLVASGSSQSYVATLNTTMFGLQDQVFSVNVGDDHTLPGASAPVDLSTTASFTVVDHSNASLSAESNRTSQTIDFGNWLKGAAPPPGQNFTLYNLAPNASPAYTADLKLTGFSANGEPAIAMNLSTFSGLTAGNGNTFVVSLDTSRYTTSGIKTVSIAALQLADDSTLPGAGNNNNGAVTVTIRGTVGAATANTSNLPAAFGPALTATIAAGGSYANLESKAAMTSGSGGAGMVGTSATILAGAASTSATVSMAWRTAAPNPQAGAQESFVSDVVDLTGMAAIDDQKKHGSVHTDTYVLQMNYDPLAIISRTGLTELAAAEAGKVVMESLDLGPDELAGTDDDLWKLAVLGNFGSENHCFRGVGPWDGDMTLGDYGVDVQSHTVWAVLDHNSQFAVVPEPGTLGLIVAGTVGLVVFRMGRRRNRRFATGPSIAG